VTVRWVLVASVACKSAPPPPPPVENRASSQSPALGPNCIVQGRVVDSATGEPQLGATLVATGGRGNEDIAISEQNGTFALKLTSAHDKLTIFYSDAHGEGPLRGCGERITIRVMVLPHGAMQFAW
jgi:hypothetical protein